MTTFSKFATSVLLFSAVLFMGQGCIGPSTKNEGLQTSGPAGIFISTDKGEAWQPIVSYPTSEGVQSLAGVSVYKIVPDPHNSETLYWLSREHGMFYTTDSGKTWQRVQGPLATGFVYDLTIHPEDPCTLFATNGTFVFKSEDCARTWEEVYRESRSEVFIRSIAFQQFASYQIFVGSSNGDLLMSSDLGSSWSLSKRFGKYIASVVPDTHQADRIYVATRESGLFRTDDAGKTWKDLSGTLKQYPGALEYRRFFLHPTKADTLYWISTYGILVSADAGDTWTPMSLITPPGSVQIYSFGINPQNENDIYYTATIPARSTFYRSIDGGQNWITRSLPTGQIPTVLYVPPSQSSWVYIGFTIPTK
ncbi:MAG: hypothetical protein COU32_02590 [Candidatus Magasanikbacteria bacterium CG10_big_fil_rev_8_21_14_0_10_42_10]|uniref:Sortilin N-terminal domain-containing protein n=2 Tax=Candidatus Magasanikiibacteriota TaxID=1752731 RepID=A0A2H0TW22_9BACT|nr:MAG: hypothetical protein COU32_02590 [Candidatus Magasanikbacteria bacterium CG10_big_fil_rev_8_21_14_0_10_42_10]PIZ93479.1 MAG: hypothetical protein COX82_02595 [Candidatus Magasanikbacteria bacterium CG_4_10_14_0_2_um_filter_41_10]